MKLHRLLPSLFLFLAGCVSLGDARSYPSLAKRPIEDQKQFSAQPAPGPDAPLALAPAPVDASDDTKLASTIANFSKQAFASKRNFDAVYGSVSGTVRSARGAPTLSEQWSVAQVGISKLEAARNDGVVALAGLDRLYIDRVNGVSQGVTAGGAEKIDAARVQALAIVDSQNDRLDALKQLLK